MTTPLRLGHVTGSTPDTWAGRWRERHRDVPLTLVPLTEVDQEARIRDGDVDLALVRLPIDRTGMHVVRLYDERAVVVVSTDHVVSAVEEVTTDDLDDEQLVLPHRTGWRPSTPQLDWPATDERGAVELVATGAGVAVLPMAVARFLHRRDVVHRPVTDLPETTVALAWLVERDDDQIQAFVGIARGRTSRSSRG